MNRAKRRAFCRRWGHLPAGARCARCGTSLPDLRLPEPGKVALIVVLCLAAALVGPTLGLFFDVMRMR